MLSVFLLKDNIRKWVPPFLRCSRTSADTLVHCNCMWRLQHSPAAKGDNLYQHFLRKIYVGSFGIEGHLAPCGQRTDLRFFEDDLLAVQDGAGTKRYKAWWKDSRGVLETMNTEFHFSPLTLVPCLSSLAHKHDTEITNYITVMKRNMTINT